MENFLIVIFWTFYLGGAILSFLSPVLVPMLFMWLCIYAFSKF